MRILIVKMSSMGDVVHAQPLATDLRRHCPDAQIDWVVESAFAGLPAMNPAVDTVIPMAWRRWRKSLGQSGTRAAMQAFWQRLRSQRYHLVLDCQGLLKSAAVVRMARADRRVGPDRHSAREGLAALAYDQPVPVPRDWHVVRRNRAIGAAALGYAIEDPARFGLSVPPLTADEAPWLPQRASALLVTGASRDAKLWPEPQWVEVALRLQQAGLDLIWFWGSPAEEARARRLALAATEAAGAAATQSVVPPFLSVHDAARVIQGARIVVGLDTGFTHLAGALGRPTIGIFADFDAVQCAVSGDSFCASFGGVGVIPPTADVLAAIEQGLRADPAPPS
ncbi:MAG: lipopolysaccharide heptosyltransferase I [Lautropia sp.]|nr:lipopolysaccharide heptosyltransferase I [Lautropia sp.]